MCNDRNSFNLRKFILLEGNASESLIHSRFCASEFETKIKFSYSYNITVAISDASKWTTVVENA